MFIVPLRPADAAPLAALYAEHASEKQHVTVQVPAQRRNPLRRRQLAAGHAR